VKKLSDLEGRQVLSTDLQAQSLLPSVCHYPELPLDLKPICASQEADGVFKALSKCSYPSSYSLTVKHSVTTDREVAESQPLLSSELPQFGHSAGNPFSPWESFKYSTGRREGSTRNNPINRQ
jgi:hypothetical protein